MLWRLLWSLSRGVRPLIGGGGGAAGFSRHRPVAPVRTYEGESSPLGPESTQTDGRHQQHKGCEYGNLLHHCTPLDAFTLSALAVLALEVAKQIHWLSSGQLGRRDGRLRQLESQLTVLPQHQHSVPPRALSTCSSEKEEQKFFVGEDVDYALKSPSSSKTSQSKQYQFFSETGDSLFLPSTGSEADSYQLHLQGNLGDESVSEAASQVQQVFQASISTASNILGLEKMHEGQYKMAFSCFKLAADQNHSKAEFNVGLCYEHGIGTKKNVAKAVLYYQRAARQGHAMAQFRYAKCLLHHCPRADNSGSIQEAVGLSDQAATGELTQDSLSSFHLGVCYEKGIGALQNLLTARKDRQDTAAPNVKPVEDRIKVTTPEEMAAMQIWHQSPLVVRTFSSSPCLQSLDQPLTSRLGEPALGLLHSWSTGSLRNVAYSTPDCVPSTAFPNGFSLKLQSLTSFPGIAVG